MALEQRIYTLEDIKALPEGQRAELIDGELYMLAAPSTMHQRLSMGLSVTICQHIKAHSGTCEVFAAPFAVYPFDDDKTYLEPDISVVCDSDKLREDGCHGAPDFVIEIASPSTIKHDLNVKRQLYQRAGVKLYLVIMPDADSSILFDFQTDTISLYPFSEEIPVTLCPGLSLRIADYL